MIVSRKRLTATPSNENNLAYKSIAYTDLLTMIYLLAFILTTLSKLNPSRQLYIECSEILRQNNFWTTEKNFKFDRSN
jgi:hypothetical protein